jgi:hypothetical protein
VASLAQTHRRYRAMSTARCGRAGFAFRHAVFRDSSAEPFGSVKRHNASWRISPFERENQNPLEAHCQVRIVGGINSAIHVAAALNRDRRRHPWSSTAGSYDYENRCPISGRQPDGCGRGCKLGNFVLAAFVARPTTTGKGSVVAARHSRLG